MPPTIELTVPAWKLALQGLGKIINKRASLPVLSAIRVEREANRLSLQVTDLDRFLTHRSDSPGSDTRILVPFEPLQQAVKDADRDSIVRVTHRDGSEVVIESVVAGQQVSQRHTTPALKEWPTMPRITVDSDPVDEKFQVALRQALDCSSRDDSRHILRGACLDTTSKGDYVVGTDGRHLFAANSFRFPHRLPVIIPAHKFLTWKGFAEDGGWRLGIQTGKDPEEIANIVLQSPRWTCVTRPIEGSYPNWRQVVPQGNAQTTIHLADESIVWFKSTLPKLPVADPYTKSLLFTAIGQQLHIRCNAADGGVDLAVPGAEVVGSDVAIALNRDMVLKALKFGFTTLAINEPLDPVKFTAPGRQMIIMPVRQTSSARTATSSRTAATQLPPSNRINKSNTQPSNERKPMSATPTQPQAAKAATQLPIGKVEELRNQLREINSGLGEVLRALKDAAKEQRTTEREVNTIRNRLRSLQSVEI